MQKQINIMKQIYKQYHLWEDYKNGMYDLFEASDIEIQKGVSLLSNTDLFFNTCLEILDNWVISCDVNLTNLSINRKAWLGQASCNYKYKLNELAVRKCWALLSNEQRYKANIVADKIISIYEAKNKKIHSGLGNQMLLQWNT